MAVTKVKRGDEKMAGVNEKKAAVVKSPEMEDAREFVELYGQLSKNEKQQVKSIMIGIQIAKQAPEVATA